MSGYWEKQKTQKDFESWLSMYDGCVGCACDHGCNQWLVENQTKAALMFRIIRNKGTTNLDRVARMDTLKANLIWFFLSYRRSKKVNRFLNDSRVYFPLTEEEAKELHAKSGVYMMLEGRYRFVYKDKPLSPNTQYFRVEGATLEQMDEYCRSVK